MAGTTTTITWSWGANTVLEFDPTTDVLDFGWFSSTNFTITEVDGSVVISIPSNNQTYTLKGVTLAALSMDNITARDASALTAWQTALDSAAAGSDSGSDDNSGDTSGDTTDDDTGSSGGTDDSDSSSGDTTDDSDVTSDYAAAWISTSVYTAGDRVSVGNSVYEAQWWTQGEDPSDGGSVWTFVGYMDDTPVVPDAPDDLYAASTSASTTVLVWDAAEVNGVGTVSAYNIYQDGELIATTTSTYYKVTGLDASTTYSFTVSAVDEAGSSAVSEAVSVTTKDEDSSSSSKTFSPYIDMSLTSSQDLVGIVTAAGLSAVTLAFVLSSGTDTLGWGGSGSISSDTLSNGTSILSQIEQLQAMGVDVTISLGGANGQEGALTFSSAEALTAAYQELIDRYHVTKLDFDIEGSAIANDSANALRNEALVALQEANPDLEVSFTLPVLTTGLTQDGIDLLTSAMEAGVEISTVNIMAMDYGDYYDTGDMGADAISAALATIAQLQDIGLDCQIVITVMIGINDVTTEVFTLEDAQQLVDFVESNDSVAGISMWSLSRDNGSTEGYVSPTGSGLDQDTYDFSDIFNTVVTSSDSGSTGDDSGSTTDDSGSTGDDSGSTTGDSGSTGDDSGSTTGDSGSTGDDSGSTTGDSGSTGDDATGTTTSITWAWGTHTVVDFNPATDVLDFGWFSADNFTISEENGSVVISIPSNSQTYTLQGVTLAELSIDNISAKDSSAVAEWQDALDAADETASSSSGSSSGTSSSTTETTATDTTSGSTTTTGSSGSDTTGTGTTETGTTGTDTAETTGTTTSITWAWGTHAVVEFDPAKDTLDFGWLSADSFSVSEQNGSVVIAITGNEQTYTLDGVSLADLSMDDISAKDTSAVAEWQALIDAADAEAAATASSVTDPLHANDGLV